MIAAENKILKLIRGNKSGEATGITSVCSANPYVLKAAVINSRNYNQVLLVEATSNQVDQFGGYTGLTPSGFSEYVLNICKEFNFPLENLILGGDHLGPNRWQDEQSSSAMHKAKDQIVSYVSAGYSKIHLDTSMKCADDGNRDIPLGKEVIAERAAKLCRAAEDTFNSINKDYDAPVYVIGTDVPPPGGAKNGNEEIHVTSSHDVEETIDLTHKAFERYNLQDAWKRVIAVVVQPGVEFGDTKVFEYKRDRSRSLVKLIEEKDNLVYEAHSTDYQLKDSLRQMVEDHFAILKVGPWLTYAFREAVFALAAIEDELFADAASNIINVIDDRMNADSRYWLKYYNGNEDEKKFKRKYSYSDRIRYYWTDQGVQIALTKLISNLNEKTIPYTLISQFLPDQYSLVREMKIKASPDELLINKILNVFEIYNYATHGGDN